MDLSPEHIAVELAEHFGPVVFFIAGYVVYRIIKDIVDFWIKLKRSGASNDFRRQADEDARKFWQAVDTNRELLKHLAVLAENSIKLHERQYDIMEKQFAKENCVHGQITGKLDVMNERINDIRRQNG